jgi:hypothetical protein
LSPVVNVDPDVAFFRSKYNWLKSYEEQLLQDLASISGFKATSDLPQWLNASEQKALKEFLESNPTIQRKDRYKYQVYERLVDFRPAIPIFQSKSNIPIWLAKNLGLLKIIFSQALPAIWEAIKL